MQNPRRRIALLDAAIEVLARDGARGLTFRRVDEAAAVPAGTASNYFVSRDALLSQVGGHIHQRLAPDPEEVAGAMASPPSRALDTELMRDLMSRVVADRAGYVALLELRLEATRRPELRDMLTMTVRDALDESVRFHLDAGLPGGRTTVIVLYLAMTGLILEHLTLPDVLDPDSLDDLTADIVATIVPPDGGSDTPAPRPLPATK